MKRILKKLLASVIREVADEKRVSLHIGTLIGKVEIVNVPFDPKTDLEGLNQQQLHEVRQQVVSALERIISQLCTPVVSSEKDGSDDVQNKEDHQ